MCRIAIALTDCRKHINWPWTIIAVERGILDFTKAFQWLAA
jgi:hypothetical protein